MSMQYCHTCNIHIDTDFNAEHFIEHQKGCRWAGTCEDEMMEYVNDPENEGSEPCEC